MTTRPPAVLALFLAGAVLVAAGVGGAGARQRLSIAEIDRSVAAALAKVGPIGPGLGEADPAPPVTAGWSTDFSRHTVPLTEFQSGGPGKDGIPAIDRPRFTSVVRTAYLEDREPVIAFRGRAYPLQIMIWHEIVNDRVGGVPVAVTFCPLCNTAIVFDRRVGGRVLDFGTTGNLRNSDLVMYDRRTESWWQQFSGVGLAGRYAGARLRQLPAQIVPWSAFRLAYPKGLVLTPETGYSRPYGRNPYYGYDTVDSAPWFPTKNRGDKRLPPKERVVYVERGNDAVAVPFSALVLRKQIAVDVGRHRLEITITGEASSPLNRDVTANGRRVPAVEVRERGQRVQFATPFWFAVAAFRPNARILR